MNLRNENKILVARPITATIVRCLTPIYRSENDLGGELDLALRAGLRLERRAGDHAELVALEAKGR